MSGSQTLGGSSMCGRVMGPALDKIMKNVAWRKHPQLVSSAKSTLDRLEQLNETADPLADPSEAEVLLEPLFLALETESVKVVEPALEGLWKLFSFGLIRAEIDVGDVKLKGDFNSFVFRIIDSVCKAVALREDTIELGILRVLLSAVRSPSMLIRGDCLVYVVRASYNIYLRGVKGTNQICAKAVLAQMVVIIFARVQKDSMEASFRTVSVAELLEFTDRNLNEGSSVHFVQNFVNEVVQVNENVQELKPQCVVENGEGMADGKMDNGVDSGSSSKIRADGLMLYKNLCRLSMKFSSPEDSDDHILLRGKILSLELLKVIMDNADHLWLTDEMFVDVMKKSLCHSLFKNCAVSDMTIFQLLCSMFKTLLAKFRSVLKSDLGVFFNMLILHILENVTQPSFLQKMTVLNLLEKISQDPQMIVDIFVNYDCDVDALNIFERTVNGLLKTAVGAPPGSKSTLAPAQDITFRVESVKCLLRVIKSMGAWMDQQLKSGRVSKVKSSDNVIPSTTSINGEGSVNDNEVRLETDSEPSDEATLEQRRAYKLELQKGVLLFNQKPSMGTNFLISSKRIGSSPEEVAIFLKNTTGLSENMIGEYLDDEEKFPLRVMHAYVDSFKFEGMDFGEAIRLLFRGFRLPGEAQKIDRIMEKFGERYCKCNPNSFTSANTAYVLAYSVIMLNTDAHSSKMKDKVSKADFIRNNQGINDGKDLSEEYMGALYDEIVKNEIKMNADPSEPQSKQTNSVNNLLGPDVVLIFFLTWRIQHPNWDAMWLWGMSIVCEIWFAISWVLDQIPKLRPINRSTDLEVLREKFDMPSPSNPTGRSDLPGVDMFVSTADPDKEPVLVTANTILSILAVDYPVDKLACYLSDDGGALLTFEAMAEAASFADLWVPFCRKHDIEPRNPESYFSLKGDPTKNKLKADFVKDRRRIKREYEEFKVRINSLPESIRRRSDAFNAREEMKILKQAREKAGGDIMEIQNIKPPVATWMADGSHWPGAWIVGSKDHSKGDHEAVLQVMLKPPSDDPLMGSTDDLLDFSDIDMRLPTLVYVSREKRKGYDHNKKAGAMNALVRASAVLTNGAFILNLDCDHYICNSKAVREGMCFMMDRGGEDICYVQFPQRFEGIDKSDRYANHNTVFFDGNMRALDGLQGPVYVGTGTMFRRFALYGFEPPQADKILKEKQTESETEKLTTLDFDPELDINLLPKRFGNSKIMVESIAIAEYQGRPIADHQAVKYGRPPGLLRAPKEPLDSGTVTEAVSVVSCWYEDKTEWGDRVGWIYGSVTEDVVTGYRMHNRGWRSVYWITKRDAFRGSAPINLTDRLHQVLRWATGSVEIFFSRNNAFIGTRKLMFLQRMAYINVGIYPFTSIFLVVYCFLPALSLFSGQFIVQTLNVTFLLFLLGITICLILLALLELKWSGVGLEQWWRNEQFWLISGTSAHLAAILQGLLKVIAGIEISFTLTSKSGGEDDDDQFRELYIVKWSFLMIPPIVIGLINVVAIFVAFAKTIMAMNPEWAKFVGGTFFAFWVLAHLYPFAKGLMGRRGRTPTIVFVWAGLIAITLSLLWIAISPPGGSSGLNNFQFP